MMVFVSTALFIGWLSGEQKRAKESLGHARDELEAKVQERTAELKKSQRTIAVRDRRAGGGCRSCDPAQAEIARIAR
jgi:hypothetical protein